MARHFIHKEEIIIDLPIEQVWSLVSAFGALVAWMPSIKWCTMEGQGEIGSVRTVMSLAGEAKEKLEVCDHAKHEFSYRIMDPLPLPAKGGFGNWKLQYINEDKTKVVWVADAEEVSPEGVAVIQPLYEPFMKESLAGLEKVLMKR